MTRRAPIIVVVCALLLTVAFWYLLYQPRREETARYTAETAQLESQRAQLQAQIAGLREIERDAEEYRSRLGRLAEFIPDDPAQPTALRELQRAADESGVDIVETTFADPEVVADAPQTGGADTTLAQIATEMTVEGGYFQVVDLLRRIEVDLARAIKIDTVAMAESEEDFPRLSVTWTGQMFAVLPTVDVVDESGVPVQPQPSEGATAAPTDGTTPTDGQTAAPPDGTSDTGVS